MSSCFVTLLMILPLLFSLEILCLLELQVSKVSEVSRITEVSKGTQVSREPQVNCCRIKILGYIINTIYEVSTTKKRHKYQHYSVLLTFVSREIKISPKRKGRKVHSLRGLHGMQSAESAVWWDRSSIESKTLCTPCNNPWRESVASIWREKFP